MSDQPDWPTLGTSDIWKQFRREALAGPVLKWFQQDWSINLKFEASVNPSFPGRVCIDEATNKVTVHTPDYKHIFSIQHQLKAYNPSLMKVKFAADRQSAEISRMGRGQARWELPA